tara:strand:- start:139782 stop:140234 length:453 start_codon:yes stop_codon:yes gene_type:complete
MEGKVVQIFVSGLIDAPVAPVWKLVRDFGALGAWHPDVVTCRLEDGCDGTTIGARRTMTMKNMGGEIEEVLVALSDEARQVIYTLSPGPLPVWDYRAVLALLPITMEDRTVVSWRATYSAPPDLQLDLQQASTGIFTGGIEALISHFSGT